MRIKKSNSKEVAQEMRGQVSRWFINFMMSTNELFASEVSPIKSGGEFHEYQDTSACI